MNVKDTSTTAVHPPVVIEWVSEMQFDVGRPGGLRVRIDGDAKSGPGPFDALLSAIATCAATDIVAILEEQRAELCALHIGVEATRVIETPRRLASAILHFTMRGSNLTAAQAERVVSIAITKYCSVRSSLIADAAISWTIELQ
jgi:putative redox protein